MTLIGLLIVLLLVGVGLYLLNMIPMDGAIKTIIRVVAILVVVLWVVSALGLFNAGPALPRFR